MTYPGSYSRWALYYVRFLAVLSIPGFYFCSPATLQLSLLLDVSTCRRNTSTCQRVLLYFYGPYRCSLLREMSSKTRGGIGWLLRHAILDSNWLGRISRLGLYYVYLNPFGSYLGCSVLNWVSFSHPSPLTDYTITLMSGTEMQNSLYPCDSELQSGRACNGMFILCAKHLGKTRCRYVTATSVVMSNRNRFW
jgi:hypothetical protein